MREPQKRGINGFDNGIPGDVAKDAPDTPACVEGSGRSVYLMYDAKDAEEGSMLVDGLRRLGYDILTPVLAGDFLQMRRHHDDCLMHADCMVILAVQAHIQWVQMKMVDIVKSPGLGRPRPILTQLLLWNHRRGQQQLGHADRFELIEYTDPDNTLEQVACHLSA